MGSKHEMHLKNKQKGQMGMERISQVHDSKREMHMGNGCKGEIGTAKASLTCRQQTLRGKQTHTSMGTRRYKSKQIKGSISNCKPTHQNQSYAYITRTQSWNFACTWPKTEAIYTSNSNSSNTDAYMRKKSRKSISN